MVHLTSPAAPDMILYDNVRVWCLQDGTVSTTPHYRVLCRNCESLQERPVQPHYCLYCGTPLTSRLDTTVTPADLVHAFKPDTARAQRPAERHDISVSDISANPIADEKAQRN